MEAPVNFDNLRNITGGDVKLESQLYALFLSDAGKCLQRLKTALGDGNETGWRQHAHAMKGACMNVGAERLSALCHKAQMDWREASEDKQLILGKIEDEFAYVRKALESVCKEAGLELERPL